MKDEKTKNTKMKNREIKNTVMNCFEKKIILC